MMNFQDKNVTIGAIVAELPKASKIFSEYGIDFCCGGHRKLYDEIQEHGVNEKEIYKALSLAANERTESGQEKDFINMRPAVLTDYIEGHHHVYLRHALPEIAELLNTILRVHGKNHQELFEVYRMFGTLKTDLEQHLLKEETMLFPALEVAQDNPKEVLRLAINIIKEHEAAGNILGKLREVTNNYTPPKDACGTYHRAYEKLVELEKDLHQHIHLENNILLKEYDDRE